MSKHIFFIILLFISFDIFAQNKTIEVVYELKYKTGKTNFDALKGLPEKSMKKVLEGMKKAKKVRDFYKLIISENKSKYTYSHSYNPENIRFELHSLDYYKDFNNKKVISISPAMPPDTKIQYEMMTIQDWVLTGEQVETICGFKCKNAKSKKGDISAWYTTEIKVGEGPEKYSGLPGLILKIETDNGKKTIIAQKVNFLQKNIKIDIPNRPKSITLEQFKSSNRFR